MGLGGSRTQRKSKTCQVGAAFSFVLTRGVLPLKKIQESIQTRGAPILNKVRIWRKTKYTVGRSGGRAGKKQAHQHMVLGGRPVASKRALEKAGMHKTNRSQNGPDLGQRLADSSWEDLYPSLVSTEGGAAKAVVSPSAGSMFKHADVGATGFLEKPNRTLS